MFKHSLVLLIMSLLHVVVLLCGLVFTFLSKGLLENKALNLECLIFFFPRKEENPTK